MGSRVSSGCNINERPNLLVRPSKIAETGWPIDENSVESRAEMYGSYWGQVFIVGLGGFIGSAGRFAVSGLVQRLFPLSGFPYGTLVVNVIGCLAIGFIGGLLELRQLLTPAQRLFLLVGVLGGFTTFSAFAYATLHLLHAADFARAIANVISNVVFGLTAAWIGHLASQHL